eukprot:jgi/Mesvir1/23261/Mv12877-RA.9
MFIGKMSRACLGMVTVTFMTIGGKSAMQADLGRWRACPTVAFPAPFPHCSFLGNFDSKLDAATAHDYAAINFHQHSKVATNLPASYAYSKELGFIMGLSFQALANMLRMCAKLLRQPRSKVAPTKTLDTAGTVRYVPDSLNRLFSQGGGSDSTAESALLNYEEEHNLRAIFSASAAIAKQVGMQREVAMSVSGRHGAVSAGAGWPACTSPCGEPVCRGCATRGGLDPQGSERAFVTSGSKQQPQLTCATCGEYSPGARPFLQALRENKTISSASIALLLGDGKGVVRNRKLRAGAMPPPSEPSHPLSAPAGSQLGDQFLERSDHMTSVTLSAGREGGYLSAGIRSSMAAGTTMAPANVTSWDQASGKDDRSCSGNVDDSHSCISSSSSMMDGDINTSANTNASNGDTTNGGSARNAGFKRSLTYVKDGGHQLSASQVTDGLATVRPRPGHHRRESQDSCEPFKGAEAAHGALAFLGMMDTGVPVSRAHAVEVPHTPERQADGYEQRARSCPPLYIGVPNKRPLKQLRVAVGAKCAGRMAAMSPTVVARGSSCFLSGSHTTSHVQSHGHGIQCRGVDSISSGGALGEGASSGVTKDADGGVKFVAGGPVGWPAVHIPEMLHMSAACVHELSGGSGVRAVAMAVPVTGGRSLLSCLYQEMPPTSPCAPSTPPTPAAPVSGRTLRNCSDIFAVGRGASDVVSGKAMPASGCESGLALNGSGGPALSGNGNASPPPCTPVRMGSRESCTVEAISAMSPPKGLPFPVSAPSPATSDGVCLCARAPCGCLSW